MDELENLKSIWKSQSISSEKAEKLEDSIQLALDKQRRKIRRTNVFASFCMLATSVYLVSVMVNYPDESLLFYLSISGVILLMGLVLVILWKRSLKPAAHLGESSEEYIVHQLKRLKRNKKVIQLSPVYGFLLGVLINAYAYSLMEHATTEFVFWVTNINWAYIFLISYLSYIYKIRRFRKNLEPLISDLERFKHDLDIKKI